MPGYKYPNIDSGATPIGSAGRAPDRKTILRKNSTKEGKKKKKLEPMIDYKYPTIAWGLLPSGALVAHPMKSYFEKNEEENFESMNSTFYSHRESGFKNPKILGSRRIEVEN
jgi:hypothetical protein